MHDISSDQKRHLHGWLAVGFRCTSLLVTLTAHCRYTRQASHKVLTAMADVVTSHATDINVPAHKYINPLDWYEREFVRMSFMMKVLVQSERQTNLVFPTPQTRSRPRRRKPQSNHANSI